MPPACSMAHLWLHGVLGKDLAEQLVADFGGGAKGTFLVRRRDTEADKYACIITLGVPGSITHHIAKPNCDGVWEVNGETYGTPRSLEEVSCSATQKTNTTHGHPPPLAIAARHR